MRLAPLTRRLIAPELSIEAYRDELLTGDRGDWLGNARAAWFTAMLLSIIGEFVALPFINVSGIADAICRVFLLLVGVCLMPLVIYTLASGWHN